MEGLMLKAEAIVAGRKLYEVSAASGFCPRTLTEIFAGRRPLDEETVARIRWDRSPPPGSMNRQARSVGP